MAFLELTSPYPELVGGAGAEYVPDRCPADVGGPDQDNECVCVGGCSTVNIMHEIP
jgi:hypothetical protein